MPGKPIDMSTGNPSGPSFLDTSVSGEILAIYRTGAGISAARSAALQMFQEHGVGATGSGLDSPRNVVLGLGSTHLYGLVLRDLRNQCADVQKPVVLVTGPTYGVFADRIASIGFIEEHVPLFREHNWKLSPQVLDNTIQRLQREGKTVVAFYCMNPHNPSGAISTRSDLQEIVPILCQTQALIIDDLAYSGLEFGTEKAFPLGAFPELAPVTVSLISLSKSYSAPGARSGAMHGPLGLVHRIAEFITAEMGAVPVPSQVGFEQVVKNPTAAQEFQALRRQGYQSQMRYAAALVGGLNRSRLSPKERANIKQELMSWMEPSIVNDLSEVGLPFVEILNSTDQSGFFMTLDFSNYEGLYHRNVCLRSASDIRHALLVHKQLLMLDAAAMRMGSHYPFALRMTTQTSKVNIARTIQRLHTFLVELTDKPTQ